MNIAYNIFVTKAAATTPEPAESLCPPVTVTPSGRQKQSQGRSTRNAWLHPVRRLGLPHRAASLGLSDRKQTPNQISTEQLQPEGTRITPYCPKGTYRSPQSSSSPAISIACTTWLPVVPAQKEPS